MTGLDSSVLLTGLDLGEVRRFLDGPERWRVPYAVDGRRPSALIADALTARGAL
jgi:hypothetical protein